jgi:Ser/Thr protein kinase RdoA (MazF antagonist)
VLCHADLWPAHVRFEGDSFAGFADFESLAFASPAMDLAQLVGHFGGWQTFDPVLGAYGASAPLKKGDIASLAPEAVADLTAEGLWALEALYGRSGDASPAQEATHRSTSACC